MLIIRKLQIGISSFGKNERGCLITSICHSERSEESRFFNTFIEILRPYGAQTSSLSIAEE